MSLKTFRERSPVVIGIISIVAIATMTTFAFYIDRLPFVKQAYQIQAQFANAAGLSAENQVRVAGIKVGTVESIELVGAGQSSALAGVQAQSADDAAGYVLVTMGIDNGVELPKESFAEIKLATLLGTKFVDIEAKGSGDLLEHGDVIPLERTAVPYEIYQASNQGTGVLEDLDGELLNEMLTELASLIEETKQELGVALEGVHELGGGLNARSSELRSLLAGAEDLTRLLSEEGDELTALIDASNQVLGSLARKREALQSLLESTKIMAGELETILADHRGDLDSIFDDLHSALVVLERNVEHLDMMFEYSGPSSRYFARVFTQGPWGDIFTCALILSGGCEH